MWHRHRDEGNTSHKARSGALLLVQHNGTDYSWDVLPGTQSPWTIVTTKPLMSGTAPTDFEAREAADAWVDNVWTHM